MRGGNRNLTGKRGAGGRWFGKADNIFSNFAKKNGPRIFNPVLYHLSYPPDFFNLRNWRLLRRVVAESDTKITATIGRRQPLKILVRAGGPAGLALDKRKTRFRFDAAYRFLKRRNRHTSHIRRPAWPPLFPEAAAGFNAKLCLLVVFETWPVVATLRVLWAGLGSAGVS